MYITAEHSPPYDQKLNSSFTCFFLQDTNEPLLLFTKPLVPDKLAATGITSPALDSLKKQLLNYSTSQNPWTNWERRSNSIRQMELSFTVEVTKQLFTSDNKKIPSCFYDPNFLFHPTGALKETILS